MQFAIEYFETKNLYYNLILIQKIVVKFKRQIHVLSNNDIPRDNRDTSPSSKFHTSS